MTNLPAIQKLSITRYESRDIPTYLTPDEVHALLEACKGKRDHLFLNLAWQTGGRVSEILSLSRDDIDAHNSHIRLVTAKQKGKKGKVHRIIPIGSDLLSELLAYILDEHVENRLFNFSRQRGFQIVRQSAERAGLSSKRIHPHTLRHSYAVNCLSQGVPLPVLKDLLGHASILTTLIYVRIVQQDVREFLNRVRF